MNEAQTELVEWEEASPGCYALRLRMWETRAEVEG